MTKPTPETVKQPIEAKDKNRLTKAINEGRAIITSGGSKADAARANYAGSALLRHLFMLTPIMNHSGFITDHEFSKDDLNEFIDACIDLKSFLETQFQGMTVRASVKNDPCRQLNELLKLVGLKNKKRRSAKRSDGGKTTYYKLDVDALAQMNAPHDLKEYRSSPWELINERYNF
jgi:hypothetical protein